MKISNGEDDGGDEQRTVVVGIKMDAESRELLTWALVKVARPGGRVVALHVISDASDASGSWCLTHLSLVKAFNSVLAGYDGFCNLKQIDLKLKLCRGDSIRQVLVRETISYGASSLILGINKHSHFFGSSSTSIAKYCSKKLHKYCTVFAVNNGKIVFHRESAEIGKFSRINSEKVRDYDYLLGNKGQRATSSYASRPSFHCLPVALRQMFTSVSMHRIDSKASYRSSSSQEEEGDQNCTRRDHSIALVPTKRHESLLNSVRSLIVQESHEAKPGRPLLQTAVLSDKKANLHEKSRISFVQRAIQLPSRRTATASAIHSDRKRNDFDGEGLAIVLPMGRTDSLCSSVAISNKEMELTEELRYLQYKYSSICRLFSYKELEQATSNFSPEKLIGRGGSSKVYKGCLSDGKELAVKLLKPSEDVVKEFVSEIETIIALHHKNIISLLGFCFENHNLMLVYDFLSRGSLEEILHGKKDNRDVLSWAERYKIAVGVAEALNYLHDGGNTELVIHRDIKSSNILLSDDFGPRLADFGLALWASSASSNMTCNDVAGTIGYLAPEYFMHGKVTEKVDVYAYGVVLLELLSGRKPISSGCPKGEESLVIWAKKIMREDKGKQLVDPRLGDKYDSEQLERMILAASICIRQAPQSRPHIALAVKLLQGDPNILRCARSQVNSTEDLDDLDDDDAAAPNSNIQSHIKLALLDIEDDTISVSTADQTVEDYLRGRWSSSSSFD